MSKLYIRPREDSGGRSGGYGLEQVKALGKAGKMVEMMTKIDLVILDEPGHLPFSPSGGALLFHRLSKLYARSSVIITTNLSFSEWAHVFGDANMSTALLDRLTHRCHILETGDDNYRFNASSEAAKKKTKGEANIDHHITADTYTKVGQISVKIPGQFSTQINSWCPMMGLSCDEISSQGNGVMLSNSVVSL